MGKVLNTLKMGILNMKEIILKMKEMEMEN